MSFVLGSLLYALLGSIVGMVTHLFNGIAQTHIQFTSRYIKSVVINFLKLSFVWIGTVMITSGLILLIPESLLKNINTDTIFLHGLVYYLYAFAAFDFTLKYVVENKHSLEFK
jgi:hypothetical protein